MLQAENVNRNKHVSDFTTMRINQKWLSLLWYIRSGEGKLPKSHFTGTIVILVWASVHKKVDRHQQHFPKFGIVFSYDYSFVLTFSEQ